MTGVEVEPVTAQIARHLYPDAEIVTSGLEEVELADGGFDAVVGNVPYGRYARFDKVHNKDLALSIHDHFVLKSLYATRPGGVVALITSRYTMDALDPGARTRMYELGDLVGAVRLPARAHATAAGTDVVTDVLFLRRRLPGEEPGDDTWLTSTKRQLPGHDDELAVNTYFDAHPEYVLGELRAGSREWGPEVTVVGRTDQTPAQALASAAAAITVEARAAGLTAADDQRTAPVATIVTSGTEGALGLDSEGNPTIIDGGRPVPLEVHPDQREQLLQLIRLKGLTLDLYELEAATDEPGETPDLARLRAELRVAWRDYRKTHPPLTKPRQHFKFTPADARAQATAQGLKDVPEAWKHRTAFAWIDDDPDASLLFGLEEWDDRSGKGIEQKVLRARVLEPRILPVRANSHEDAIALAMEYDGGRLDMSRVASLLGLDEESAAAQIADAGLAYRDPQQSDAWEPGHRYLSGNVRTKLAAARERAAEDPTFQGNVAALERVQPSDLAPSEIKAKIGAPWIPVDVYNDFLAHLGFEDASVVHAGGTVWEVRGAKNGDLARTEWGTGSRPTQDLFTALLRQTESTVKVTWTDKDGRTYVDKEATDAAQEKAKLIAEAFEDWVWDDEPRAGRLAKIYNQQFNNLVLPEYSPAALTLPGLISDWTMKEHQNAAIRRIVNEPTALLAHVVGAGKTATMAAGAMELRRTGLAQKPCLIVPNHMLKQWSREFRQLYPNAKLLAITASDLNKKRRAKFMGRIAGGEWDAVILTHDAFTRVPLRPDTQRAYLDREMRSLREQLDAAAEAGMARNTVKQIEESLANAEAKLQQQIDSMDDEIGVFLEDTGIDYVFLDEAHEFKNLRTVSAIPGAAIQGSAKATKLHMVLDHLRATNESERVATLATGTPIANSVTEAYVLKRYLAPQLLEEMGLDAFDNWAATFGEVVSNLEPDPKGDGYKYKARFSRFFNVPELMAGYRTFADVQMAEDLNLPTPPVRENEDGQRGEYVLIPPTPAQRQFIKELPHQPWVRKPGGVLKALGEGLRASVDLDLVDATEALRNLGLNVTADQVMSDDPVYGGRVLDMEKVAQLADAAATDMRSLGGTKEMGSKIPSAAEKIAEIWQETKDIVYPVSGDDPAPQDLPGGLQLVFLDEGTPGSTAKHAANLYQDLRDELVARGMPRESIRFIHEAGTDRKKEKLFADCRAGRVRVLVGSTQKMGTGTNIQDRAVALHHLSYPWRPADMAQRDGRIERRGNLNAPWIDNTPDDVRILYYITERTFDEFRLTTLARKARFIGQIQRRDFSAREIEDIGADAINLGMLSALASGDPAILQLAEATAERARLQGLARSWDRQQDTRSQQLTDIDDFLARADTALEGMRAAAPNRRPTTGDAFAMTVDDATYRSRDTAANALGARMAAIAADQSIRPGEHVPIGTFGNQDFHAEIAFGASGRRQLRLRFAWGNVVPIGHREDRAQWQASSVTPSNGRGAIQSLEHFLNNLDSDLEKLDASVISSRARREEIAGNLRPKDENPYRIQARSKEREERALGKLVVANEKEAALAERVERAASVNEDAAEEVTEELTTLREHIASLRQSIADEHEIQARAQGLVQPETAPDDQSETPTPEDTPAAETAPAGEATQTAGPTAAADPTPPAEPHDPNPAPEPGADTPVDGQEEPEPERSREQQFREAVDELFTGAVPVPEEPGAYDLGAGEHDPVLAQMIAQDVAAMSGEGWTEVVQPFASQREATFEQNHVDVVYERWAATQTALPMLVDAEGELTDEDPGITNPAGLVASWHHRSRVAAVTAGPTGGRMVVEQFEGLAQAALRADGYLAERDAYASEEDRALLLQLANVASSYARRLAATLDVLAQQRTEDRQESQASVRMREVQALESAMEYLGAQGADFRMDRRNTTITDREAAGAQLRDDLLQTMREVAELPLERQNTDPDARVLYGHIRGIPLYFGWGDTTGSQAQAVLGFDQLPLLEPISITAAELEAMSPAQLIDRIDGRLGLDALSAVRDRERAAIQDLLAAGAQEQQSAPADQPAPATTDPIAELQRQSLKLNDWWLTSSDVAVPEGHQPFSDATVDLVAGDQVRIGSRQYMEDRHLHYHTVTVQSGPDRSDGYYLCTNADGIRRRFHPRNIVAVPDGSRLLAGNAPAPEQTATPEPTQDQETTEQDPQEHTGPSPEWARIAAVLRYYEPLLQRHKLSGRETVAFLDRPGAGYRYEPGNPLSDLMAAIAKAGERAGGSYRISYNEWVNYSVGERRQQQSDTLTNLSIDLMTLYGGETEPLFLVDLEAILAAPPGTVVELPSEAELAADDAAAARIVINHDAEGTDVRNTPPGGAAGIREALNDLGFKWSRRQQKWYQRRDTPFEDRDTAVRGLRAAFEKLGVAYTYNGPEQAPQGGQEAAEDTQQQTADTAGPETAPPGQTPADTPAPETGKDGEPDTPAPDTNDADERLTLPDPEPDSPEETEETSVGPETAPALIVQTPDGPGTVIGSDGDLVLVSAASGTRVWEAGEVQWPDGAARPENTDQAAKKRQNAADAEQATTAEGIELQFGGGNRLVDLDPEAGHGTVVDADGTVIGWVRARTGDDGRRYWWGQDARGGAPDGSPFHEELPPSAGVPAIRAAGRVRSTMVRATEPEHRHPTTVEYAAREVRLTTAQVRELRQLTLTATYSDGSAIEPPEWVGAYRRYFLNVAQIRALGEAAQAAAAALPGATAEDRRTARVLRNAAERFAFEAYDTARWRATIPPIGETDPYANPYQPPAASEATGEPDAAPGPEEREQTATDAPAPSQTQAPAEASPETSAQAPAEQTEQDLVAAAQDVGPAPHWRIVGAESDEQAAARFGGNDLMLAFAARVQAVPTPSALTDTSADVWMDGRMVGRIIDVNDAADFTGPGGAPLWSAEPVFGTSDERLARFRSRDAALAELAVRALRTGPPALDRLDDDMVASFTRYLTQPLPEATSDDAVSAARLAELTAVLDAFAQGRSLGSSIAEDLVLAHDSLLWLAATQPDVQVRDDLETRADTIRSYLNVFRPGDPRAAQNWASDQPSDTAPAPAPAADPVPDRAEDGEEGQLDLFPSETPDTPAPQRPPRRRGGRGKEPAIPPRTEGGPQDGRTGVYGHADHGECDRCGTPDTSRYTVVWQWHSPESGAMAAECAPCVELTLGLPYAEIARLADLAEVRRGGERIQPRPHPEGFDVVTRRTADKEFTSVHLPTGKRYRQAQESPSGYQGYVTRDLYGISHGTTVGLSDSVARRAALGHTAETHPNSSDGWVLFSYRQDLKQVLLHDGETVVSRGNNPRTSGVFENGPRWDMTISGTAYVVEMIYQTGPVGDDGHRLEITAPDQSSTRHVHWDGTLEWAREHARTTGTTANVPAEELTTVEETTPPLDTTETAQPELDLGTKGPEDENDPEYEVSVPGEEPAATTTPEPIDPPAPVPEAEAGPPADDEADEAAPERVRGPMLTLGLREGPEGQIVARVEAGDGVHALVLPGISTADVPGLSLPVTVEMPMLVRSAELAEQLVSDGETAAWLGEHLPTGPLAAAWSSDRVRVVLIVVVRDSLRDDMAPSVDDVATWLVSTAAENEGLLHAAHTAGPEAFGAAFASAADSLIADGGSEHLLWTYLGGDGTRRAEVLTVATPEAYAQLLALPAPGDTPAAPPPAPTASPQDAPEDSEMATPARPDEDGTPVPPAQPAPEPAPEASPAAQQDPADDFEVEEPPEPQRRTTFFDLPNYDGHRVFLSGWDGMADDAGELRREGPVIATLHRTEGGWYARMQLDTPDLTPLVTHPETAAEQAAVMYAAFTGAPLGEPVVAAPGSDVQARAEQMRSELREFAALHTPSIEIAARHRSYAYSTNPHYIELTARLADVADAEGRGARMMAADLAGVERAVTQWGASLPPSPNSEYRVAMAFPLAHLLFDVRRLQARLQATVEVAAAEAAAERTRQQEAAATAEPAPPEPETVADDAPSAEEPSAPAADAVADAAVTEDGGPSATAAVPEPTAAAADQGEDPGPEAELSSEPLAEAYLAAEDGGSTAEPELQAAPDVPVAPLGDGEPADAPSAEDAVAAVPADTAGVPADEDVAAALAGEPTEAPDVPEVAMPGEELPLMTPAAAAPDPEPAAPLWGTDDVPVAAYEAGEDGREERPDAAGADDILTGFQGFREAWDDAVTTGVTSADLFDDVKGDLITLRTLLAEAVDGTPAPEPAAPPAEPDPAAEQRDEHREAEAVNESLREADTHAESLQDLPEWQKIQTVRGAMGHLLTTIRKRAGEEFDKLLGDKRAIGFLREWSARACDKIAGLAQAAARKLRGEDGRADERGGALPSAEALLRLGDAATTFSDSRRGPGGTPPPSGSASDQPDIPAMRKMGEALAKPMPGARPKVSAAAARGRSTTAKRSPVKKPGTDKTTEQAGHLRRGPDKPQPRKPQR
ncbi:SNF2-related protein [Streptomyces bottropensis]|uniref:SNF2-related protein n=1 Tax=Streptomyces bottropensis TaxID=42235 RepID=UPI003697A752